MNYKQLSLSLTLFAAMQAEFLLFDQGVTVVSGPVANSIITYSDVFEKLNLDGSPVSREKLIEMEIISQEVIATKMPLDETAADKYLANIQKTNNLSQQDLEDLAGQCHRTFHELKQLLTLQYTYDFFLYHKFRAHLVPSDQDVQNYCDENPQVAPGHCIVQVAFVDFNATNKAQLYEQINDLITKSGSDDFVSWSAPITIEYIDLAQDKEFLKNLAPEQIYLVESANSFELYKLISKQDTYVVPVADRKTIVVDILNRKMYEQLLLKYKQHMMDNIGIIDLY